MASSNITRYDTSGGARIYSITVPVFTTLDANIYVVIADDYAALIDTGSGLGKSNEYLRAGMAALREDWNESIDWADLDRIVITHAHIDHFGGLNEVRTLTNAPIAVHEFDRRVLINYEERLTLTSRALSSYLWRAGVDQQRHAELMGLYGLSKGLFHSVEVATTLRHGDLLDGRFRIYHVPGHCPGQICLHIDDVLLSADHILARTTPHLAPESITASTGLDHYLHSLQQIAAVPGIRLTLGGHEGPIDDLMARVEQIEASHRRKLDRVLTACAEPRTIHELSQIVYAHVQEYHTLLAIEEIGAHIEYLDQRGELAIANLEQVAQDERIAPRYRRI